MVRMTYMRSAILMTMLCLSIWGIMPSSVEASAKKSSGRTMAIAAIVNEDAITQSDIQDRLFLMIASSGLPDSPDLRHRVMPQVMEGLIEERIKIQEAQRLKIEVSDDEIGKAFKTIAEQNKFTPEQFADILKRQGINKSTLDHQIRAQIGWTKIVQQQIRPQITVSPNDVTARKSRIQEALGRTEYLVSEIFLPVDSPAQEASVRQLADKLMSELQNPKKPVPFSAVAAQFSKSPGAEEKGGSIGWIQQGQLPSEIDQVLPTLQEGQISSVIKGANSYHILQLNKKREISGESIPSDDDLLNQIGLERLTRAQARYLQDLKAAAFIDRRI